MRIDFVSDVTCPWCAIGLSSLERALDKIGDDIGAVELYMQPFQLNPTMAPEGVDAMQYLTSSSGLSEEEYTAHRARTVFDRGEFADEVREAERYWREFGIHGVPAVVVNGKHLMSGGKPHEVFEQALRQVAAERDA